MANAEVGANNIINQLKSIDDAIAIVHDSYGKMLTTDKLSDFNVTGVSAGMTGNTDWASNISVEDYSKKLSQETIDEITARIDNAQAIVEANNMEIASLEGARAEILKTLKDSSDAIDRVNSGKAGKEDKSSDKSKKDKDEKRLDDEFDRYWVIKKTIDTLDKALNKLTKDKENLYGYELIDALNEENRLLEQQKANYEALAKAQQEEASELRNQLNTMGVMFDASGSIINYAQVTSTALATYNEAVQKYNAGLIDEATFTIAEKSYEQFKNLLNRYDTLYSLIFLHFF